MQSGFIYIWFDTKRKKYYLGSHFGKKDDGYTGSNKRFSCAYKSRPETFRRRILEYYDEITHKNLLQREQLWLNLIKDVELHGIKYYNEKKVAAGGNIFATLSEEKKSQFLEKCSSASKKYWNNISKKSLEKHKKNACGGNKFSRDYLIDRNKKLCSKKAKIVHPNGFVEIIVNVSDFCKLHNLNYGNLKSVLRGNTKQKSCSGFRGNYL